MIQGHQAIKDRLNVIWILASLAGAALGLRLIQLQIVDNVEYRLAAERNSSQIIYQTAPRGRIYDRDGNAIATNEPAFSLIYLPSPGKSKEKADLKPLARELGRQLKEDPDAVFEKLEEAVQEDTAIRLAENLPPQAMFRLSELKTIYPGVDLIVEARRYYPYGRFASHLIGYMGKMDPRSWKRLKGEGYRVDSRIGRLGIEGIFEKELRGRDGGIRMQVDAQGRLKKELERINWEAGSNVHLTIDSNIQKAADEALRTSKTGRGAAVVLDPSNGAILAFSSQPDFDPNALLSTDPEAVKKTVVDLPEFDNAISGTFSPGSMFKTIVSAAGLETGAVDPKESVYCPGYFALGRKIFHCWVAKAKVGPHRHGAVDLLEAIEHSCDVYFWTMGLKIGGPTLEKYERMFGLGQRTGVALKGEKTGHLFGPETRAAAGRSWYDGDTANLSIGQGELLVTPIQMAVVAAAFANGGTLWRPHYTDRVEYGEGRPDYVQQPEKLGAVNLKPETWDIIRQGMRLVVNGDGGTAHGVNFPQLDVRGKTGTAQNSGGADHSWFMGYAGQPGQAPKIAFAVLVENGGESWEGGVPVAHKIIAAAFHLEENKPKPAKLARPLALQSLKPPVMAGGTR